MQQVAHVDRGDLAVDVDAGRSGPASTILPAKFADSGPPNTSALSTDMSRPAREGSWQ
jgi:hypothetical protein